MLKSTTHLSILERPAKNVDVGECIGECQYMRCFPCAKHKAAGPALCVDIEKMSIFPMSKYTIVTYAIAERNMEITVVGR
jgi:hypothetical protein